ncbi:hypothetical protein [Streptomyces sp. KR55]|uniref:hypothetical protein n=1 Tax=Streptomyces sp. KR55 TaxID=3457425 RepID=UPI003FD6A093
MQTLHDFTRWKREGRLLHYKAAIQQAPQEGGLDDLAEGRRRHVRRTGGVEFGGGDTERRPLLDHEIR